MRNPKVPKIVEKKRLIIKVNAVEWVTNKITNLVPKNAPDYTGHLKAVLMVP